MGPKRDELRLDKIPPHVLAWARSLLGEAAGNAAITLGLTGGDPVENPALALRGGPEGSQDTSALDDATHPPGDRRGPHDTSRASSDAPASGPRRIARPAPPAPNPNHTSEHVVVALDAAFSGVIAMQRRLLEAIRECHDGFNSADLAFIAHLPYEGADDRFLADGHRDYATWLASRLGISVWAARRWVGAAFALPRLPHIDAAFQRGELSLEKVHELCRFATPETDKDLARWARRVSLATVRERATAELARDIETEKDAHDQRYVRLSIDDEGARVFLEGLFPSDQGAVVAKALDRLAGRLPDIVADDDDFPQTPEESLDKRRADALFAMASAAIADDHDPERATVVVHAELDALLSAEKGCRVETGPVLHPDTVMRFLCDCRVEKSLHDNGETVAVGTATRNVPRWLVRQLRYRDGRCTFPGCESRWFLHAHHLWHWVDGGPTELWNLALVCTFHHRLVHEGDWTMSRVDDEIRWFRPNGERYAPEPRAGPLLAAS